MKNAKNPMVATPKIDPTVMPTMAPVLNVLGELGVRVLSDADVVELGDVLDVYVVGNEVDILIAEDVETEDVDVITAIVGTNTVNAGSVKTLVPSQHVLLQNCTAAPVDSGCHPKLNVNIVRHTSRQI